MPSLYQLPEKEEGELMGKLLFDERYGLHTIELYLKDLKYTEVQRAIDCLYEKGPIHPTKEDELNIDRSLKSTYFVEDGVRLRIHQSHNKSNGIGFIINPSTLLMNAYMPLALWIPTKDGVSKLLNRIKEIMKEIDLDTAYAEKLSLSQMDLTMNSALPEKLKATSIIRSLRRGLLPRHFEEVHDKNKERKKHLFAMKTKNILFKAYDKIYELKKNNRCPEYMNDKKIIRMEVSLKREGFLKKFPLERSDSLYKMLSAGYQNGEKLITEYIDKTIVCGNKEKYYKNAVRTIREKVEEPSLQKQMLYFLKALRKHGNDKIAQDQLTAHFKEIDNQQIQRISKAFKKLKIFTPPLYSKIKIDCLMSVKI